MYFFLGWKKVSRLQNNFVRSLFRTPTPGLLLNCLNRLFY